MKRALWLMALLAPIGQAQPDPQAQARSIYAELVGINTTQSSGNVTRAAEAMAARLRRAGFPEQDVKVIGPDATHRNLVARLRGTGRARPILFLAHLDVVEVERKEWSVEPFELTERDGYFYGRGSFDDKSGAAVLAANFIRLKQVHYQPDRDLILALTAGEETGIENGVDWLLAHGQPLIDAEYCINLDAGEGDSERGKPLVLGVQTGEKQYYTVTLEATNPGGHSSIPRKDNAIYELAAALERLAHYEFPVRLNETTRAFFAKTAGMEKGQMAADMRAVASGKPEPEAIRRLSETADFHALLRTTCTPTQLQAGQAENALPRRAIAVVNCRLLPGDSAAKVLATLHRVIADDAISITPKVKAAATNPASPLRADVLSAVEKSAAAVWPGVPVVPQMETGATDGAALRIAGIPTYGSQAIFVDLDDDRSHGKDERIPVTSFYKALEYNYRLIQALSQ
ncbi:MAG TPA: M20/M25/M40 family metallo-hydrolase [Bryobacteraceae bacterium]|nr:M20/M25/M40 family metallo-hydrolase [Bryobacteraceae bacterium]